MELWRHKVNSFKNDVINEKTDFSTLKKLAYYSTVKFKINKVVKDEKELYDVSETEKLTPRLHFIQGSENVFFWKV